MLTKGQSGELAWVTSSNILSPLMWFLGPFSHFASSLRVIHETRLALVTVYHTNTGAYQQVLFTCRMIG